MKRLKENRKGITLVSLVITIVVLLILASIATYSGIEVIKSSRLTTFTTEMKIMQTQVNELYQRKSDGDDTVADLGKSLSDVPDPEQANEAFNAAKIVTDEEKNGYKYFDQVTINELNIEEVSGTFLINVDKRSVISYEGFQDNETTYYTLEQLPNGLYNVEYTDTNTGKPTFNTELERLSENKWKVNITDVQYNTGNINKWKVKYRYKNQQNWNSSDDLNFMVDKEGSYFVKLVNGNIESEEKEQPVWKGYVGDGIILCLDGINNTRNGHDTNATVWEDLSGNNNDFVKVTSAQDPLWSDNSFKGDGVNRALNNNKALLENATGCTVQVCYDIPQLYNYDWVFQSRKTNANPIGFQFAVDEFHRTQTVFVNTIKKYSLNDLKKENVTDVNIRTMGIALDDSVIEFSDNDEFFSENVDDQYINSVTPIDNYTIGSAYPWQSFYFKGNIYEIRMYNRKLSQAEQLYNYELDKERFNLE